MVKSRTVLSPNQSSEGESHGVSELQGNLALKILPGHPHQLLWEVTHAMGDSAWWGDGQRSRKQTTPPDLKKKTEVSSFLTSQPLRLPLAFYLKVKAGKNRNVVCRVSAPTLKSRHGKEG